jgi:hypothetical protein
VVGTGASGGSLGRLGDVRIRVGFACCPFSGYLVQVWMWGLHVLIG